MVSASNGDSLPPARIVIDYEVVEQQVEICGRTWQLKTLKDRQQFHDPSGDYEVAGISPATWPLFGVIWSAGLLLAEHMANYPVEGLRILEAGCGLALASMVVQSRGGDITASDIHPLAGDFLAENAARNRLAPIPFKIIDWSQAQAGASWDLIIGSDLLYERGQPELLARFVTSHANAAIVADPGRGQAARFNQLMSQKGFSVEQHFYGKSRLVSYARSTLSHQGVISTT